MQTAILTRILTANIRLSSRWITRIGTNLEELATSTAHSKYAQTKSGRLSFSHLYYKSQEHNRQQSTKLIHEKRFGRLFLGRHLPDSHGSLCGTLWLGLWVERRPSDGSRLQFTSRVDRFPVCLRAKCQVLFVSRVRYGFHETKLCESSQ